MRQINANFHCLDIRISVLGVFLLDGILDGTDFQKGSGIQLCGSIQSRSWDGQDGKKQYATEVVADELSFNGPKRQSQDGDFRNPVQSGFSAPPIQEQPAFDGGFDDGGFADIDGSEDDLPF